MANPAPASFWTQANALFRKNLTYQKRNVKTNIRLILFPVLLCVLLVVLQRALDRVQSKDNDGNNCVNKSNNEGGANWYTTGDVSKVPVCAVPNPPQWPPFFQLPNLQFSAFQTNILPFSDLQQNKCRAHDKCALIMLFTASNFSFAQSVYGNMFTSPFHIDPTDTMGSLATNVLGTETVQVENIYLEPAFAVDVPIYYLQNKCKLNSTFSITFEEGGVTFADKEVRCIQCLRLWRNSSSDINSELYQGYYNGNTKGQINEIAAAFDLLNSNENGFNVIIWHTSTKRSDARSINLISNAYLQSVVGPSAKMLFDFVKEMPKHWITSKIDIGSLLGSLLYIWVIMQLFPVILASLVYEKEQKLRLMMQMHGLSHGPYWVISYGYFLTISVIYMLCFVVFGSLLGLSFFRLNDYSVQFVFYFIYINLQISVAFLVSSMFSKVKTATVSAFIVVFSTGLLAGFLSEASVSSSSLPTWWTIVMELYPGFALSRGLYEFADSASSGDGVQWENMTDSTSGMIQVLIIMSVEWIVVLYVAYYIDQGRSPFSFFKRSRKQHSSSTQKLSIGQQLGYNAMVHLQKPDIMQEREKVEQLLLQPTSNHAIVCDELKKVYPGQDRNPEKVAVRGLSLALPQGECFGMLGPNGAGKTSFINMMIGLTKPTAGTAYVQGLDIRNQINEIYATTGVCPQHDLLWESLTGREHLLFYGRLKNLKGSALTQAVEESLKNLNIFHGGVADKRAGTYSGGMKRRLSVAISLIGDPKVVYMDEPSTGLDPASRNSLWNVIKVAKQDRAIILTTHSMEEAEALCDRLGIFVNGSLQCIGNPNELKSRYGGSYVFTMTTHLYHEKNVENMVLQFSPNAKKIYHISGTQKFELPKGEVRISDVFRAVENAKRHFTVSAWGLADTTMEDVFIKVARGAQESIDLS